MGSISMDLYLNHQRIRYKRGSRALKQQILDEFCALHGYHRKAAIGHLNGRMCVLAKLAGVASVRIMTLLFF